MTDLTLREHAAVEIAKGIAAGNILSNYNATAIALHTAFPTQRYENRCALKDFRATVEGVVESRTKELVEEMGP